MNRSCTILVMTAASVVAGCGPSNTVTIQACGATFPSPLYERWFLEFYLVNPDCRVNYQATGSGAGVRQFEEGLVQLGATDEPLKKERLEAIAKNLGVAEIMQVPMTAGSVALCYNLPIHAPLKLSRKALVDILLGTLTYWDDERITSTNADVYLPHLEITFIRRAEGSGTTFVFTNHLNAIDSRWRKENGGPGAGKTVQWPVNFIGGKGNAGVAALIQQTPGSLGYIESGYAEMTKMPMAALQNQSLVNFVQPTTKNSLEALEDAEKYQLFNDVMGATIPDPKGPTAYPIVTFTWIICRKNYADARLAQKLKEVLNYCLESKERGKGQSLSEELGYVPLPEETLVKARKLVAQISGH
jgi:phosphate transport system substrate-binding protein